MQKLFVLCLFLLIQLIVQAQDEPVQEDYLLEDISELSQSNFELDTYSELLERYKLDPLNINSANYDELMQLQILSPHQAYNLLHYRYEFGYFITLYELIAVDGIDKQTIEQLLPYIKVESIWNSNLKLKHLFKYGKQNIFIRYKQTLEQKAGYKSQSGNPYLGNPQAYYLRYNVSLHNKISLGFTVEQDAGEPFFNDKNRSGFDYYSAHFFQRRNGWLKTIAIGDYHLKIGQGLLINTGFSLNKSSAVTNIQKSGSILRAYTSSQENKFLRGFAGQIKMGNFLWTNFISNKKIDANQIYYDSLNNALPGVSGLPTTGLHRTKNELEDKNAIQNLLVGSNMAYNSDRFHISITGMYNKFNKLIDLTNSTYGKFRFKGTALANIGAEYFYNFRKGSFFGEIAMSDNSKLAILNGYNAILNEKVELSIMNRYYDKAYHSMYSNAFSESSKINNESAWYVGLAVKPTAKWTLNGYMDVYKSDWLKFGVNAPSRGVDYLLMLKYQPSYNWNMYVRLKHENNLMNNNESVTINTSSNKQLSKLRYHVNKKVNKYVLLSTRIEYSWYKDYKKAARGILLYQDISYQFRKMPLNFSTRLALFDINDFDARIYAYEKDVLYNFSIPSFNGKGSRFYFNVKYDIKKSFTVWLRLAQTRLFDVSSIGSGLEEIKGNTKTEFKIQVRLSF